MASKVVSKNVFYKPFCKCTYFILFSIPHAFRCYYASPEVWKDQPYDGKSDIWSMGCLLYEMCALVPPFRADDMQGLYKKVVKGKYPRIPDHFS